MMKDVRKLYQPYVPKIFNDKQGFNYLLSEESVFGNLYYSMNQDFLVGKSVDLNISKNPLESHSERKGPVKLIPILRYKKG